MARDNGDGTWTLVQGGFAATVDGKPVRTSTGAVARYTHHADAKWVAETRSRGNRG